MDNLDLIERACHVFQHQVGTHATLRPQTPTPDATDQKLIFRPKGGRIDRIYRAVPMPDFDSTTVARLIRDKDDIAPSIVITYFVTNEHAKRLKAAEIPFLDLAGNVYLAEPGFFAFVSGCPAPRDLIIPVAIRPPRLFKDAGIRLLLVLLARPGYVDRPYREIANAAGIALGTVAGLMGDLKQLGYLLDLGKDGKRLQQREKLIEEWTGVYARDFAPRRKARRFRAENSDWWKTAELESLKVLWGCDVAANKLTGYLKPADVSLYAQGMPGPLLKHYRMRADPLGDLTVYEQFWNFPPNALEQKLHVAPPLLVYGDLMATGDPRAIETAGLIHAKYLARPDTEN